MSYLNPMRLFCMLILAFCAFLMYETLGYPGGAAAMPRGILALLMVCTCILFVRNDAAYHSFSIKRPGQFWIGAALCIAYVFGLYLFGYYAASIAYFVITVLFLRYRKPQFIAAVAIGYPLCIYVIFEILLRLPMPEGSVFQI